MVAIGRCATPAPPVPMPSVNRPPDSSETVAAWPASDCGFQFSALTTEIPVRRRPVAASAHRAQTWKASGMVTALVHRLAKPRAAADRAI